MGHAARVFVAPDSLREVHRVPHHQLDEWLDQLRPLFDQEKPPTQLNRPKRVDAKRYTTILTNIGPGILGIRGQMHNAPNPRAAIRIT